MAVVALQIVGALALKLYEVVQTVSANRTQCGVICDRVGRIMTEVDTLDPNKHETLFKKGVFANFHSTLESAVDLCSKFVDKSNFRQWYAYNSDNEKFDTIVGRLDQAIQDLQLSLAFDTSTWQQAWQKAQQTDTATMINLLDGLFQGQQNIMEAVAEIKLSFQQGVWNATQSPTDTHPWHLNSREIKFDRVKDEDEDLWHKAEPLGSGSFGTVYRGVFRDEAVAIKSVNFNSTKAQENFIKEVNILFMLHHPNITTFHGAVLKPKSGDMVLELFDRSLADALHIDGHVKLKEDEKLAIVNHITSAMQYLHSTSPKIIHSDLKPGNVMITTKGRAKIIDFGLSATKSSSRSSRNKVGTAGTTPYQPPELHQTGVGDHTVDIYAFGITVNEIFTEEIPFAEVAAKRIAHLVRKGARPPIATTLPLHLRQIVQGCLQKKPTSRPEFLEIYVNLYQHSNRKPSLIRRQNSSGQTSSHPTGIPLVDFYNAYHGIVLDFVAPMSGGAASACKEILVKIEAKVEVRREELGLTSITTSLQHWKLSKNVIVLKYWQPDLLDGLLHQFGVKALIIQCAFRQHLARKIYKPMKQKYADELASAATFVSDIAQRSSRLRQNLDSLIEKDLHRDTSEATSQSHQQLPQPSAVVDADVPGDQQSSGQPLSRLASGFAPPTTRRNSVTKLNPETTPSSPSWIFAGGASGAIQNFTQVFKYPPEHYLEYGEWSFISMCRTVEKQKAVGFMLATNATVTGWNGTLNLGYNDIGDEGAQHIGNGVKHSTSLKKLYLNCNLISATGAKYIGESLMRLIYLSLIGNQIRDEGAKHISEGVKHSTSLQRLDLQFNDINDKGAKHIGDGVKHSKSLKILNMGDNSLSANAKKKLKRTCSIVEELSL